MRKILLGTFVVLGVVLAGSFVAHANEGSNMNNGEMMNHMMDHKSVGSTLEVHINDNGKVLVRGAEVTAVSGNIITVKNMFGNYAMTWTVNTDTNTKFIRKYGGASGVAEVSVGDFISFTGMFDMTAATPTVKASLIKDWSIQKLDQVLTGSVKSLNTAGSSFVVTTHNKGDVTVQTNGTTTFMNGLSTTTMASVLVDSHVKVRGVWNSQTNILTASNVRLLIEDGSEHEND